MRRWTPTWSMACAAAAPARRRSSAPPPTASIACCRARPRSTFPLDTGDFRLMSRRALDALLAMPEQARFIRGMVAWIGFRQVPFAYDRDERFAGETKYPLRKMMRFALDALTGFSSAPLKLASHAGLLLSVGSLLLVALHRYAGWLAGRSIQGWTSLMLVVVVLGAVQMFVLALMGEYIGRLYNEAKRRPLYIVQEVAGGERRCGAARLCRRSDCEEREPRRQGQRADQVTLGREEALEAPVERRWRKREIDVLLAAQSSMPGARRRRAGKAGC